MSQLPRHGHDGIRWATRIGVILAVTGSAVGLGNFLRFPGEAAQHGGGTFMIPYIICFILLGLPLAWVEWSLGRYGGRKGFNSLPGIFRSVSHMRGVPYLGVLGLVLPVMVYSYYIYVVGWCLAYAWFYATGHMVSEEVKADYWAFFVDFVGAGEDGSAFANPLTSPLIFVAIAFALNFILIYRGITKGIELFCKWAMPLLALIALIIVIRVLTLPANPAYPEQNVINGLGYMWNPVHREEVLVPGSVPIGALLDAAGDTATPMLDGERLFSEAHVEDAAAWAVALRDTGWRPDDRADFDLRLRIWVDPAAWEGRIPDEPRTERQRGRAEAWRAVDTGGWAPATFDDIAGQWVHPDTRLRTEMGPQIASFTLPGFWESMFNARLWLAAAGQIFFSLSLGFGVIITYASYLRKDDDVALSSVTAAAGNGFCEVALAGMMVIPAGFIFLGMTFVENPPGTFGMGFAALPEVFAQMPGGRLFGFLFFFLLFLGAITSTISLLQPAIAFLEEGVGLARRSSVALLGFFVAVGAGFVIYFSGGFVALDTIDFWTANVGIVLLATISVIMHGWVLGIDKGYEELTRGAIIKVPPLIKFVIKYVSPLLLITVFVAWFYDDFGDRLAAMDGNPPVLMSALFIVLLLIVFALLIADGVRRWRRIERQHKEVSP